MTGEDAAEDFISAFSQATDEQKVEDFDRSTTALILRQLGYPLPVVRALQRDLGQAFGSEWFNQERLVPPRLSVGRCFSFNLTETLTRPRQSPVSRMWEEVREQDLEGDLCLVFKCYKLGRLVATDMALPSGSYIHVQAGTDSFNITPFPQFFGDRYGHIFEG